MDKEQLTRDFFELDTSYGEHGERLDVSTICKWWIDRMGWAIKARDEEFKKILNSGKKMYELGKKDRDEELIEKTKKLENFECLDLYSQPDDDLIFKKDVINLIHNNNVENN